MSQENVDAVQRALEAWNAGNLDAFLAELDPEGEWHPAVERALDGGGTVYRGHDGARRAWNEYHGGAWGSSRAHIHEIRDLGETVLVLGHFDVSGPRRLALSSARKPGRSSPSGAGRPFAPRTS